RRSESHTIAADTRVIEDVPRVEPPSGGRKKDITKDAMRACIGHQMGARPRYLAAELQRLARNGDAGRREGDCKNAMGISQRVLMALSQAPPQVRRVVRGTQR